jgi:hypothetical protein
VVVLAAQAVRGPQELDIYIQVQSNKVFRVEQVPQQVRYLLLAVVVEQQLLV